MACHIIQGPQYPKHPRSRPPPPDSHHLLFLSSSFVKLCLRKPRLDTTAFDSSFDNHNFPQNHFPNSNVHHHHEHHTQARVFTAGRLPHWAALATQHGDYAPLSFSMSLSWLRLVAATMWTTGSESGRPLHFFIAEGGRKSPSVPHAKSGMPLVAGLYSHPAQSQEEGDDDRLVHTDVVGVDTWGNGVEVPVANRNGMCGLNGPLSPGRCSSLVSPVWPLLSSMPTTAKFPGSSPESATPWQQEPCSGCSVTLLRVQC